LEFCGFLDTYEKLGYPNYVRLLVDEAPKANSCVRSSPHDTVHNPRDASNTTPTPQNAKSPLTLQVAARASRPHRHLKGPPAHRRATTPPSTQPPCHTVVHYTPNTPCHPHTTEVDCTLSKHSGGFATIDPRHAGDTPQSSAYGSNSPQATNKDKPHQTNTRATPPQTSATASPTETPQTPHVTQISPRWTAL